MLQNQIQLKQWGLSLNLSRTLNKYIVTNCFMETHTNALYLVIQLQRLSEPFWMSLFVPSICLILAAEVALFIDETHFEALIMVSLTSNLVMYTLYNAIQADLPEDSTLKLIDIWLLHGLVMPMVVFIVLAVNELVASKGPHLAQEQKWQTPLSCFQPQFKRKKIFMDQRFKNVCLCAKY